MTDSADMCEFLPWDSEFFGRRIARVKTSTLNTATVQAIANWCDAQKIDCLYFLADMNDAVTVAMAEQNGFRCVDVRLTFERNLAAGEAFNVATETLLRPATVSDIPALRAMARTNHRDSRFYFDAKFSTEKADSLFEKWIEKSCCGYAQLVFVADIGGEPAAYITCHRVENETGNIGLVGVREDIRGRRIGQHLVFKALDWFSRQQASKVTVVTQARNVAAQRLYQRCGFVTQSIGLYYHRWFS